MALSWGERHEDRVELTEQDSPYAVEGDHEGALSVANGCDTEVGSRFAASMVDTGAMHKGERLRFVAIVGVVMAVLSAGFALAGDAIDDPSDEPTTTCEPTGDPVEDGNTVEDGDTVQDGDTVEDSDDPEGTEDEGSEEGEESDDAEGGEDPEGADEGEDSDDAEEGEECPDETDVSEEPSGDDAEDGEEETTVEPTEERVAECTEAAGLTAEDAPDGSPVPGELTGLENAIAHVLWNCMRNDNDGLVNALEHLSANLERKELRDEAKEERRAEREAARAERRAAHDAARAAREAARNSS